jgi:hypothetical protein
MCCHWCSLSVRSLVALSSRNPIAARSLWLLIVQAFCLIIPLVALMANVFSPMACHFPARLGPGWSALNIFTVCVAVSSPWIRTCNVVFILAPALLLVLPSSVSLCSW